MCDHGVEVTGFGRFAKLSFKVIARNIATGASAPGVGLQSPGMKKEQLFPAQ